MTRDIAGFSRDLFWEQFHEGAGLISRRTIISLLLALLLAGGLAAWSAGRRDECSAYLAGVTGAPRDEVVPMGSHVMRVGCDEWFLRQPEGVQVLCLVVGAGFVVFVVSAWGDLLRNSFVVIDKM